MPSLEPYKDKDLPDKFLGWIEVLRQKFKAIPKFSSGTGSPEGVIYGGQADRYFRTDGALGTYEYLKTTSTGNTGWIAVA